MRVCLALNNYEDYEVISKAPILSAAGMDCGKVLYSSEYLVQVITSDLTDVLVIDAEIAGPDAFECINKIKSQKAIEAIVIAPRADFSYAYQAMKSRVCELLVRPFTPEQISDALLVASKHLRSENSNMAPGNGNSRNSFAEQVSVIINGTKIIDEINLAYHTTFQEGLFRVVSFAVDYTNIRQIKEIANQVWHAIQKFFHSNFWFHTYDVVYSIIYNEIRIILNYPASADSEIIRLLPNLFLYAQSTCSSSPGLKLFMGVGRAYSDINLLPDSCEESKNGLWNRMSPNHSENRIVTYTDDNISNKYRTKILELDKKIINAMDTLNKELFIKNVNALFELPTDVLCTSFAKHTILNQVRHFRIVFQERINQFDNAYTFYYATKMTLLTSQTFDEYKKRYIRSFSDMFDRLIAYNDESRQAKYISRVKNMIKNDYMHNLTLESVAEEIELSPNYLSRIFREETGKTFSDYLMAQRLDTAKTLLAETEYRIKEISSSVGYADQRYFSRIFTKEFGVTPSEYRSIQKKD